MTHKSYILAYTIREDETYTDRYEVFDSLESARAEYRAILKQDNLFTASISLGIEGTDI